MASIAVSQSQSIEFTENKGQWEGDFQYRAQMGNVTIFLHADGYTILQQHEGDFRRLRNHLHGHSSNSHSSQESTPGNRETTGLVKPSELGREDLNVRSHAYRVRFQGATASAQSEGRSLVSSHVNYFIGNDSSRWKSGVRIFQEIVYRNIYPNVDIRYYTYSGRLKYDLILRPGADLSKVAMTMDGGAKWSIRDGELVTTTSVGETRQLKPYTYQIEGGVKREVGCRYRLKEGVVRFDVADYRSGQELVIDPEFVMGTFSGSRGDNWGFTATPGPDGSLFAGGIVLETGYPTTPGAYDRDFSGDYDIGISRFKADGTGPEMYATYIGGSRYDYPHSLIADGSGNLIILGRSNSDNYPSLSSHGPLGGTDIVVTKLDATGSLLMGSIKIGGSLSDGSNSDDGPAYACNLPLAYNYGDINRSEVVIDAANNVYIASSTRSIDLPFKGANVQRGGGQDALLVKLTPDLKTVLACVPFGGTADDAGFGIKLNPLTNEIFMVGVTQSANLPGAKPTVANPAHTIKASAPGDVDGFITVFNNAGSQLLRTAYLGTPAIDFVYGIQFDDKGFPYIMGISRGSWTVFNAPFSIPGSRQFISKLKPDLTAFVYSTVFGTVNSRPNISPVAFLVDRCENVYISGWGGKLNPCGLGSCFSQNTVGVANMLPAPTPSAIFPNTDGRDFYILVMRRDAVEPLYSTYFGQIGGQGDHVDGGTSRFDSRGTIYQSICANCFGNIGCDPIYDVTRPLRALPGAPHPANAAAPDGCNMYAFKIKLDFSGVEAGLQPSIGGVANDTVGCVGVSIDFSDTTASGTSFQWDFGDGSPVKTTPDPFTSHTYTKKGTYKVKLTSTDPLKCIPTDVSERTVIIKDDPADIAFDALKTGPNCTDLIYQFTNKSDGKGRPFGSNSFEWDFGDGSPPQIAGLNDILTHTYKSPGTYNVKLKLLDPAFCNEREVKQVSFKIYPDVKADFEVDEKVCAPFTVKFLNTSAGGTKYTWEFLTEGSTYVGQEPPNRTYTTPGSYDVKLTAEDPSTCNKKDFKTITIKVGSPPVAAFTFSPPNPGLANTPTQFTNLSTNATSYIWNFGDGNTSELKDPVYQYVATFKNNVCLIATNDFGCIARDCQIVESLVNPLLDVPKAFSPNMDGKNDVLYVRGFGITKLEFRVYNRWGQMVFQSTNPSDGWDGKFKGRIQPMDVYAYTLEAEFGSGQKLSKKGEITLLR